MPKVVREYTDFTGGINKQIAEFVAEEKDLQASYWCDDVLNMAVGTDGIVDMEGFSQVLSSALPDKVQGLFEHNGDLLAAADGKIYTVSGSTATQKYTGLDISANWTATEFNELLILCNGADNPMQWNGTTVATVSMNDPDSIWNGFKPSVSAVFRGRMFYAGDPAHPHDILTPRPGTHNNFESSGNNVDRIAIDPGYGGKIVAIVPFTDNALIIYKEKAIYRLTGDTPFGGQGEPFAILPISGDEQIGCLAARTVIQVNKEHYFLSSRGLRKLSTTDKFGAIEPEQPHYVVTELINGINWTSDVVSNAVAVYIPAEDHIYLTVPYGASTTNDYTLVYDVTRGANMRRDGIRANAYVIKNRRLYHGDYSGNLYLHGNIQTEAGNAIQSYWKSKWITHSGISTLKRYNRLTLLVNHNGQGDFVIKWSILQEGKGITQQETLTAGGGALWDSAIWDITAWDDGGINELTLRHLGKGRAIKLEVYNAASGQRVRINQINLEYDVLSTRKG